MAPTTQAGTAGRKILRILDRPFRQERVRRASHQRHVRRQPGLRQGPRQRPHQERPGLHRERAVRRSGQVASSRNDPTSSARSAPAARRSARGSRPGTERTPRPANPTVCVSAETRPTGRSPSCGCTRRSDAGASPISRSLRPPRWHWFGLPQSLMLRERRASGRPTAARPATGHRGRESD